MKRLVCILLGSLLLAPPGFALKPAPEEPNTRSSKLSTELGAFVQQAMDEGLLDPVGKTPLADPSQTGTQSSSPLDIEPHGSEAIDCSRPYPLDFSGLAGLSQYSDIYAYREQPPAPLEAEEAPASHPGVELAKAYIALDLSAEAAMTLKTARSPDAAVVYKFAQFLDGTASSPVPYFARLTRCYPDAALWLAVALVSSQDESGVPLLEAQLPAFRKLPLHLRDRAAMMVIPELDAMGERTFAKLLLGTFSEKEIAGSSQLRFNRAVLELASGSSNAEKQIGDFLVQSRFQEAALAALVRHKRPVNEAVSEILFDNRIDRIERAQQDSDVREDLRFVLSELGADSAYVPMMRLAELPSLQSPAARAELTSHLIESLARDLESEDSLRNLAAIEALIKDSGLLDTAPERAELFESATVVAVRLGFGALGDKLANKAVGGEAVAEQRAVLAYRQKKLAEVFDLASRYPKNQKINLLAARAAIDSNDKAKLASLESRLDRQPETILTLIEQDAAAGHWIVSPSLFDAASKLTAEDQQVRVRRVAGLRPAKSPPEAAGRLTMTSIPSKLNQTRESLQLLSGQTAPDQSTGGTP